MNFPKRHLLIALSLVGLSLGAYYYYNNQTTSSDEVIIQQKELFYMEQKQQKLIINKLNKLLANTSVLLIQTLNYHWNLTGQEFHDYHLLFDKQYNELFGYLDLLAERVRAVEGVALGSMDAMIKVATLKEDKGEVPTPKHMIKRLLEQYECQIAEYRDVIKILEADTDDFGSINMLEDLLMKHEKTTWMLRSLLGK